MDQERQHRRRPKAAASWSIRPSPGRDGSLPGAPHGETQYTGISGDQSTRYGL